MLPDQLTYKKIKSLPLWPNQLLMQDKWLKWWQSIKTEIIRVCYRLSEEVLWIQSSQRWFKNGKKMWRIGMKESGKERITARHWKSMRILECPPLWIVQTVENISNYLLKKANLRFIVIMKIIILVINLITHPLLQALQFLLQMIHLLSDNELILILEIDIMLLDVFIIYLKILFYYL